MTQKIPVQAVTEQLTGAQSMEALPLMDACHNDQYLIQAAQVAGTHPKGLLVRVQAPSRCGNCAHQGGCALGVLGRWARRRPQHLVIPTQCSVPQGAWLWIGLPKLVFLHSLLSLYFLPVVCVLLGGAFGGWFLPVSGAPDVRTALGMLLGAVAGGVWAHWRVRRVTKKSAAVRPVVVLWPVTGQ